MNSWEKFDYYASFLNKKGIEDLMCIYPKSTRDLLNDPRSIVWSGLYRGEKIAVKYRDGRYWKRERRVRKNIRSVNAILPVLGTFTQHESLFRHNHFQIEPYAPSLSERTTDYYDFLMTYAVALEGMQEVHNAGFVHADIAPRNVFLYGGGKLGDFDLSRPIGSKIEFYGRRVVPPEFLPKHSGRASIGIDLYLFCANIPLDNLILPEPIRREVQRVVQKGISTNIDMRYPSVDALASDYYSLLRKIDEKR